jgi:hypothetical protein
VNTPVAAGITVKVLGLATVNWLEESWQKHRSLRLASVVAEALPKWRIAYLMLFREEREAVKVKPIDE